MPSKSNVHNVLDYKLIFIFPVMKRKSFIQLLNDQRNSLHYADIYMMSIPCKLVPNCFISANPQVTAFDRFTLHLTLALKSPFKQSPQQ